MNAKEFGEYLKGLRREKKLTIRQLDLYSGVSNSYISQMERGSRGIPSPDILKKLSKPLGVTYEELMSKAGYFDSGEEKFEDLLRKVFKFFVIYMDKESQNLADLLKEIDSSINPSEYDFNETYDYLTLEEKIKLLHLFLDMFLSNDGSFKAEETINYEITDKYNSLSGRKREMVNNMIDMLYSDK